VLYMCSSPFIARRETGFVLDWVRQLRGCDDERVRALGVLIRPHPQNASQWHDIDLTGLENVVVWPREGADPSDVGSKADYHNSIYHCAVVMGINTSALIESAIVGRPVHTLLAPEFRDTQEGTLHFHHLTRENGGLLHVSATFHEHIQKLAEALEAGGHRDEQSSQFVKSFVRPFGLDVPATPRVVTALEGLTEVEPTGDGVWRSWSTKLLQCALRPVAARVGRQQLTRGGAASKDGIGKAPGRRHQSLLQLEVSDSPNRRRRSGRDQLPESGTKRAVGQRDV
jgi:hypothetical protein